MTPPRTPDPYPLDLSDWAPEDVIRRWREAHGDHYIPAIVRYENGWFVLSSTLSYRRKPRRVRRDEMAKMIHHLENMPPAKREGA